MLLTGTPLAWLVQAYSWRAGFVVLAAWLGAGLAGRSACGCASRRAPSAQPKESMPAALRQFGALFAMPHTLGILLLGAVTYAAFISLRGLWLGPLMIERHGYSLVQSGNVALAVSVISLFGPPLFGRLDRDGPARRRWIVICGLAYAALFAAIAFTHLGLARHRRHRADRPALGLHRLAVRRRAGRLPGALTGRAMAVFTMAMFLGVALMQWLTGVAASVAAAHGVDPLSGRCWRPSPRCWCWASRPSRGCPRRRPRRLDRETPRNRLCRAAGVAPGRGWEKRHAVRAAWASPCLQILKARWISGRTRSAYSRCLRM